ncbi:NAD(P)/FAD-dependent oxidoreductase [Pseudogemmobacter sonorensis]|uniref:NAD(P)/FAD-dependent oxidoreductase n=1 Tax=Pseudogemmobacter sonorensis TaxID=2989681 RepID=UPI00367D56E9
MRDQPGHIHHPGHAVVIGAGIVGVAVVHALLDDGWGVTLLDPGAPGGTQAASHGNGAFISPASIVPMSMPGVWRNVPGWLLDPLGPLTIRWRALPRLVPWLWRFLAAGRTEARVRRTAGILSGLLQDGPERHLKLAAAHGLDGMIRREGLVYAYPDRAAFEADALAWRLRRENGLEWQEVEGEALRALEPALGPGHRFAAVVAAGAHCSDPAGYVAALADAAILRGARHVRAAATGFRIDAGRLSAVETGAGVGAIECDRAVICAGIHSAGLARAAGDAVPLVSERGYHVQLPDAHGGPARPVLPSDGKMANTPLAGGLRASGQVELATTEAAPDWRRADILVDNLRRTYPGLRFDAAKAIRWMGHRPSTPDGLPVIGRARASGQVLHAFGHGHVGLAGAPKTAAIVAALAGGRAPPIPADPFSAARFRRATTRREEDAMPPA